MADDAAAPATPPAADRHEVLAAVLDGAEALPPELEGKGDDHLGERELTAREHAEAEVKGAEAEPAAPPGMCIECSDQPASLACDQCEDDFCDVCFDSIHRKGARRRHTTTKVEMPAAMAAALAAANAQAPGSGAGAGAAAGATGAGAGSGGAAASTGGDGDVPADGATKSSASALAVVSGVGAAAGAAAVTTSDGNFRDRAVYIPLRLGFEERKRLRLIEAALNVSEYTDRVDIYAAAHSKRQRILTQIKDICGILSGLLVAVDYRRGQALVKDKEFREYAEFFQDMFELARRYKRMNPEKLRSEYGKMLYLLQDSRMPHIAELLEFDCVTPVRTVYTMLESKGALALLDDPLMEVATHEILPHGRSRMEIQRLIREKDQARKALYRKYVAPGLTQDDIELALVSINDNNSFLTMNRDPVDKMITLLKTHFSPDTIEEGFSLGITFGQGGARLSHSHDRQYHYVLQTLTLWREVAHDFYRLWTLAEDDLLNPDNPYRLRDTGQGLNRVQAGPKTRAAMHRILHRTQKQVSAWVGSSVIHLGDINVPSAFHLLDKYTQVARILNPIVIVLRMLEPGSPMLQDAGVADFVDRRFGGPARAQKIIMADFFKHAWDGSGADNFFSAGSCIDGRLTSAWAWCEKVEKKPYFPLFLLSGFVGFDGSFK